MNTFACNGTRKERVFHRASYASPCQTLNIIRTDIPNPSSGEGAQNSHEGP